MNLPIALPNFRIGEFPANKQELGKLAVRFGPHLISVAAVVGIAFQLFQLFSTITGMLSAPIVTVDKNIGGDSQNIPTQIDAAKIARAHLFGSQTEVTEPSALPVNTTLVLAGTIATSDPAVGYAIVGDNAANAKFYQVGSTIAGAAKLHSVYVDRVVVERNGSLETILLPRGTSSSAVINDVQLASSPETTAPSTAGNASLGRVVRFQKSSVRGQQGYRVFPSQGLKGMKDFVKMGLQPGDVVTAVNGSPVTADTINSMRSTSYAALSIVRDGKKMNVTFTAH